MAQLQDFIFINAFSLIWSDVFLSPDDPNQFFFQEDPIQYFGRLKEEGWRIILYWTRGNLPYGNINSQNERDYVMRRKHLVEALFAPLFEIMTLERIETLSPIISSASFIMGSGPGIQDANNKYVSYYDVDDILGLRPLPPIQPNTQYFLITSRLRPPLNYARGYNFITIGNTRQERYDTITNYMRQHPGVNIVQIWIPVYRYLRENKNKSIFAANDTLFPFDRPDQDNIPTVTYYTVGS